MNARNIKAGMIVDCLGSRLGTVTGTQRQGSTEMLEVRPDQGQAEGGIVLIPVDYVAQVLQNTVLLNVSCEEATRLGSPLDQQSAPVPTVRGTNQPSAATQLGGEGLQPYAATAQSAPVAANREALPSAGLTEIEAGQTLTVPVVEETLVPVKTWQEAGVLEVRKTVQTITQELDVPVRYEEATLERVPVNRVLAEGEAVAARQEGDTLIVPVIHEEVVVTKRRVLVEELRITKQVRTITRHFAEPVQREEVEISHQGLDAQTMDQPAT